MSSPAYGVDEYGGGGQSQPVADPLAAPVRHGLDHIDLSEWDTGAVMASEHSPNTITIDNTTTVDDTAADEDNTSDIASMTTCFSDSSTLSDATTLVDSDEFDFDESEYSDMPTLSYTHSDDESSLGLLDDFTDEEASNETFTWACPFCHGMGDLEEWVRWNTDLLYGSWDWI
ncbi:uncharacterized protein BO80DRAFT_440073 [Aspergillus ibericus CBS 121593]|uniref:Uncharacterized protein n=1 Tax=Aspergillus ibericus CBS 121593 TaxID=1448316 RepID=A0A395HEA5_9EURO|nr:hypothetical protein BO80DRAFT_440073 [Aspergillus ibericus CBS 121593]RAL06192.1 hypothetical protein BO80DRAFT_440073 [Aspergillus ibericus CBS 121593]